MTSSPERLEGTVDPKLLEILVCPLTKGPLEFDAAKQELISRSAKLAYPIRDGIPIMLPEEARKIEGGNRRIGSSEWRMRNFYSLLPIRHSLATTPLPSTAAALRPRGPQPGG
jgi:uncharacterized protein YbaR (Trm112 family)